MEKLITWNFPKMFVLNVLNEEEKLPMLPLKIVRKCERKSGRKKKEFLYHFKSNQSRL